MYSFYKIRQSNKYFEIDWSNYSKLKCPNNRLFTDLIFSLRNTLAKEYDGVSITYLEDNVMRALNKNYRGIDCTTDVLSFPTNLELSNLRYLGDIVISLPIVNQIVKKKCINQYTVVSILIIHGFLHLCGYDHEVDNGKMMSLQNQLEKKYCY